MGLCHQGLARALGPLPQPPTRILQAKAEANDAPKAQAVGTIGDLRHLRHGLGMLGTTCNGPQGDVGAHVSEFRLATVAVIYLYLR